MKKIETMASNGFNIKIEELENFTYSFSIEDEYSHRKINIDFKTLKSIYDQIDALETYPRDFVDIDKTTIFIAYSVIVGVATFEIRFLSGGSYKETVRIYRESMFENGFYAELKSMIQNAIDHGAK